VLDPHIPGGPLFVPDTQVLLETCFHAVGERPLGTAIKVDFLLKNPEPAAN
jgi:hypothetical protein